MIVMHAHPHAALTFTVMADTQNVERRIIFDTNNATMISRDVNAAVNTQTCPEFTAYVRVCRIEALQLV